MTKPCVIIGAGIIGATIARELSSRGIETIVLDKELRAGLHASGRNSGVIHSGINHKPGTLKAKYCLDGSRLLRQYCQDKNIPIKQCGTLVIARDDEEDERLSRVWTMGRELGVPDMYLIEGKEIASIEPLCTSFARKALYSRTGAIVDSTALLESIIDDAKSNGAQFLFGEKIKAITDTCVINKERVIQYGHLVNCGGLEADRIAHSRGIGLDLFIVPFKGSYWELRELPLKTMVYSPPDPLFPFLGVHLTPTTSGLSLAGPNAALALGREAYGSEVHVGDVYDMITRRGFWKMVARREFMYQAAQNLRTTVLQSAFLSEINSLTNVEIGKETISPYRAGIRAQLVDSEGKLVNDMVVHHRERETHILNAVSPGMTSSLAFAKDIVETILTKKD